MSPEELHLTACEAIFSRKMSRKCTKLLDQNSSENETFAAHSIVCCSIDLYLQKHIPINSLYIDY